MPFRGLIPGRFPSKELGQSRVLEIATDIWMVEGYLSTNFFGQPPSCNCFVLRDREMVLLVDTGTYPHYREPILAILARYRRAGCKRLVLMLSQGHFDHVANNDLILEAGYDDVRFLLPEAEISTLDILGHWCGEFLELRRYHDPYRQMPLGFPTAIPNLLGRISPDLAQRAVAHSIRSMLRGVETMAGRAEILPDVTRVRKQFGEVCFLGWEVGRFFAIHDASHSPGHLSFYDPEQKVLLTGDATLEINPAFLNSSLQRCIEVMGQFRRFAEGGYVELVTDAHRSSLWSPRLFEQLGCVPLSKVQLVDLLRGKQECSSFFAFYEDYYRAIRDQVLAAVERLGEATVPQLVEEFAASSNPFARFKTALVFPKVPSRLDVMVANVLREGRIPRRSEAGRILHGPRAG